MGKMTLTLVDSDQEIRIKIMQALMDDINHRLRKLAVKTVPTIRHLLERGIKAQPEYASLDNGKLAANFGLSDGKARIDYIINVWLNNIDLEVKQATIQGNMLNAGLMLRAMPTDYDSITKLPAANVITEKGQLLPWLEWLLKFGDRSIILDYNIHYGPISRSRSGRAIMTPKAGERWGVPPEFAGTITNNFLTRAIDDIKSDLDSTTATLIDKEFN